MPRKTDSSNPADWLWMAESDLAAIRVLAEREIGYPLCRSKLAEVLEKILKGELLRTGWFLEKTHDLGSYDYSDRLLTFTVGRVCSPLCTHLTVELAGPATN